MLATPPAQLKEQVNKHSRFYFLTLGFVFLVVIRLITAQTMGLMPQDAYYYYYSEHLALSYFDHPPMIAYLLKAFTVLFGKSVATIKLANYTATILTLSAFYVLSRHFLSVRRANITFLLLGSTIMVTNLSVVSLPDVPLVLFWTLSLLLLYKALFEAKGYTYWASAGITIGLAFNSKYTAVFLLFGLTLFLLASRQYRKYLFSGYFLLTLGCFLLTISPIVIWNLQNDWISFKFQSSNRFSTIAALELSPRFFFGNIGLQLTLLMPVLFAAMFTVFWKLSKRAFVRKSLPENKKLFLLCFSMPIVLFFFALSSIYLVKSNWLMPAYVATALLVGIYLPERQLKLHMGISLVLHVLLLVQVVFYPVAIRSDDTWWGWDSLAAEVKAMKGSYPDHFILADDGYKTSAVLNFYLEEPVYAGNVLGKNGLQFSLTNANLEHLKNKNALFLDAKSSFTDTLKSNAVKDELRVFFDQVTELPPIVLRDEGGNPLRKFLLYDCRNYRYGTLVRQRETAPTTISDAASALPEGR